MHFSSNTPSEGRQLAEARERPGIRLKSWLTFGPLAVIIALWCMAVFAIGIPTETPSGRNFAGDIAMFLSAGDALQRGVNPYSHQALYRSEIRYLRQRSAAAPRAKFAPLVRIGAPPLFLSAMARLNGLTFSAAA